MGSNLRGPNVAQLARSDAQLPYPLRQVAEIKTTTVDPDDDTSPITDTEMIEAERRLNESIARLNESLKPRLFDAPILVVKKPTTIMVHYNTPPPIIHTNFLQPVRAAVNVPKIETVIFNL